MNLQNMPCWFYSKKQESFDCYLHLFGVCRLPFWVIATRIGKRLDCNGLVLELDAIRAVSTSAMFLTVFAPFESQRLFDIPLYLHNNNVCDILICLNLILRHGSRGPAPRHPNHCSDSGHDPHNTHFTRRYHARPNGRVLRLHILVFSNAREPPRREAAKHLRCATTIR